MITKNEFLKFIDKVEETNKTINNLEIALNGVPLWETGLTSLLDYADRIAFSLMGKDDWSLFEGFTTDFWNLINKGESVFKVIEKDGSLHATYHYDIDPYWNIFECRELTRAPEWDGHTPAQAIERIRSLNSIRYGKWIWDNDAIDWNIGDWVCSECGGRNENIHTGKPDTIEGFGTNPYIWAGSRFCPNCGAKMEPIFP